MVTCPLPSGNRLKACCLALLLSSLARLGQFAVAGSEDFRLAASQFVRRRDVADRAVQADPVVMLQG